MRHDSGGVRQHPGVLRRCSQQDRRVARPWPASATLVSVRFLVSGGLFWGVSPGAGQDELANRGAGDASIATSSGRVLRQAHGG
jgi:hypothetical protein